MVSIDLNRELVKQLLVYVEKNIEGDEKIERALNYWAEKRREKESLCFLP